MVDDDPNDTTGSDEPSSSGAGQRRRHKVVHVIDPEAATEDDVSDWATALVDEAARNREDKELDD